MSINLQIELAPRQKSGLLLKNPVLTASGTFGYGVEYAKLVEVSRLGGVICKGTTLQSRLSHLTEAPKETVAGLLYALDGPNPGVQAITKRYAPTWADWTTPVIVNIMGNDLDDMVELATQLETLSGVAGIELNPRSADARTAWDSEPELLAELVSAVRYATSLPLIVKLTPTEVTLLPCAQRAIEAGADAISLIASPLALGIDPATRRPHLPPGRSGLSGPALKPLALRLVYELARQLRQSFPQIPILGVGGISNASDALEFLLAGASAIQVGSVTLTNPRAPIEIVEGIEAFMQQEHISDIHELIGAAL